MKASRYFVTIGKAGRTASLTVSRKVARELWDAFHILHFGLPARDFMPDNVTGTGYAFGEDSIQIHAL